jgi:hypothetical protein
MMEREDAGMSFEGKDHFSGHADRYETFRPTYPKALFAYLSSLCATRELAWDCATGNGQAAVALAPYFNTVIATDASQRQIDHARPCHNVQYHVAPADAAPLADTSVDLITACRRRVQDGRVPVRPGRTAAVSDGSSLAAQPGAGLPELVVGDAALSKADRRRSA